MSRLVRLAVAGAVLGVLAGLLKPRRVPAPVASADLRPGGS